MKNKMYVTPEVEVIEIGMTGMLCVSGGDSNVFDEDYENVGGSGDPGDVAE